MSKIKVNLKVNGKEYAEEIEPRLLLVHFLRENAELTGTHVGCDTSNCGACTVLVDGKAVKSCTMLAVQANGKEITTVEGLSKKGKLHAVQKAFIDKHGLQCGYCTSGMLITSFWLLNKKKDPSEKEIREYISGNICRCTGYQNIVEAIKHASKLMEEEETKEEEVLLH